MCDNQIPDDTFRLIQNARIKEWQIKCKFQEARIRDLEGALAQMIGTHGEKCSDPDWNCDAVKFCKQVLKGDRQ